MVTVVNNQDDLDKKVDAIGRLLKLFQFERVIYVCVTLLSLIVLLTCAVYLLISKGISDIAPIVAMFGSSGAITFTLGRLLRMWSDAMKILSPLSSSEKKDG